MIDLLIDRVGNVNVFNILNSGQYYSEANIQSSIDSDLILEYQKEISNLSQLSNQLLSNPNADKSLKPNLLKELKNLGETFFEQFFPENIIDKLKNTNDKYLHFSIDNSLADIPWELLYDGECFLADKFYIGRTVKGSITNHSKNTKSKLNMLIISDPTEDLEWAQKEGEELFKTLQEKIPSSKLHLEFIAGKQITKLKLLSMIRDKNIIHYAGHLFFSSDPLENGWLLSDNKILKAREIKNSAFSTNLVFSNSCNSTKMATNHFNTSITNFASSFLLSGIKNFIGTKWELIDNEKTLDFTKRFYLSIFNEKTIGESLNIAREYSRKNYSELDLSWGNYSLYGNPNDSILSKTITSRPKLIDPNIIKKYYPTPIAISYSNFIELDMNHSSVERMNLLIKCFDTFSKFIAVVVFSEHKQKSFHQHSDISEVKNLYELWEKTFEYISDFKKLQLGMFIENLLSILYSNRDFIFKIISWIEKFQSKELSEDSLEGYLITTQYYYENILVELSDLEKYQFLYVSIPKQKIFLLNGIFPTEIQNFSQSLPSESENKSYYLLNNLSKNSVLKLYNTEVYEESLSLSQNKFLE
jgi:CHAT domain-containing protein